VGYSMKPKFFQQGDVPFVTRRKQQRWVQEIEALELGLRCVPGDKIKHKRSQHDLNRHESQGHFDYVPNDFHRVSNLAEY